MRMNVENLIYSTAKIMSYLRHVAMFICYLFTIKPFFDVCFPFEVKLI